MSKAPVPSAREKGKSSASVRPGKTSVNRFFRTWWLIVLALLVMLAAGLTIVSQRGRQVSIAVDGGEQLVAASPSSTVGQVLAQAGTILGPQDRVSPPAGSPLSSARAITVTRVTERNAIRQAIIPYAQVLSDDPTSVRGTRRIVKAGEAGLREIHELVTLEDGREVSRSVISDQVIKEPVTEQVAAGARADPAFDAFRESALGYLGRGGVTRLSPSVVENTMFELARLRGDRYGSTRVITRQGRPWLVLNTFARSPESGILTIFWWTDELHAFAQVLGEDLNPIDARAVAAADGLELGLIASAGQSGDTVAPQYTLLRLPDTPAGQSPVWRSVWSSLAADGWRSSQGSASFTGDGLDSLAVKGVSLPADAAGSAISECRVCPHRRFESAWQRRGDVYVPVQQGVVDTPYAALWQFVSTLRSGDVTATLSLVSGTEVISGALSAGLGRPDVQWTVSGAETGRSFDLTSQQRTARVTLSQGAAGWLVSGVGPAAGHGRILFTGTRPVVRGLFLADPTGAQAPRLIGEGQHYVWSPDYRRVAYDWQGIVYVANEDGTNPQALGPGRVPAWSADSRRVAYERQAGPDWRLVIANIGDGSEVLSVTGRRPAWSPVSVQQLAFSSGPASSPAIHLLDTMSGATTLLASDGDEPQWSSDGGALAFQTSRQEMAVLSMSPASVQIVAAGWGYTWSPDGKTLAFVAGNPAGQPMVWDRASGEVRSLVGRNDVEAVSWSPDGQQLVVSLANNAGLWLVSNDGANLRSLADGRDPMWASMPRSNR